MNFTQPITESTTEVPSEALIDMPYLTYSILASIILFLIEHICRVNDFCLRPTYLLDIMTDILRSIFTTVGTIFAQISSFIRWLHCKEMLDTLFDILTSIWNFTTSPFYLLKGYIEKACSYGFGGYTVYIGSVVLALLFTFIYYRYEWLYELVASYCS